MCDLTYDGENSQIEEERSARRHVITNVYANATSLEPSVHTRAARRKTTSPPPPSLAVKSAADESTEQPWLYHAQNAGITKRKRRHQKSRQQRLRRERGLEQADRNIDKLEKKVADSKTRGRKARDRRADWDDLNGVPQQKTNEDGEEMDGHKKPLSGKSWTEKMVDVELKEAMDDIGGLELPLRKPEAENEGRKATDAPPADQQAATAPVVEDLDEVT